MRDAIQLPRKKEHSCRSRFRESSRAPRTHRSSWSPSTFPTPGRARRWSRSRPAGSATPTCTIAQGGIGDDYPYLLGHEAAGIVESVGEGVRDLAPGDYVILNWRAVCGTCRACRRGRPWYCFATFNATQKMTLEDGTELSPALGIGAFIDKTLVAAGQCTKVDPAAAPEVAGLLGCGVMAGLGAAINTGNVGRGDSVAVIGCGGVGAAAIAGARLAGAATIIAVDIDDRKLATARELGATHTINSKDDRRGRGHPGAHRRLRRGRGDRRGRPTGDLPAGVLRPRPGRHRRAGRRADPGDAAGAAAAGRLRPRRVAEVELVRRLPARAGTSRC